MTAIIEDPIQLRTKILVWAITTNVTDLIETMPPLGDYTSGVFHLLSIQFLIISQSTNRNSVGSKHEKILGDKQHFFGLHPEP